jgi:uncharacterized protein
MEIAGFSLAFLIGLIMGLLGAGGSILSSAIFIYIFGISPVLSASYTLVNMAVISVIGAVQYYKKDRVDIRTGFLFSLPAILMVYWMRTFIMPKIPAIFFRYHHIFFSRDLLIILIFALLMIIISYTMIRIPKLRQDSSAENKSILLIIILGLTAGALTGFVGVGGGFIIVPSLVFFARLDVKRAVGTSLLIITINSSTGVLSDFSAGASYNWDFLIKFISITIAGMIVSSRLSGKISNEKLKRIFGFAILVTGCWIIVKEVFLKHGYYV